MTPDSLKGSIVGQLGFERIWEGEAPAEPLRHEGSPGGSPARIAYQNEFANSIRNVPPIILKTDRRSFPTPPDNTSNN